jgi:hypothetical protein
MPWEVSPDTKRRWDVLPGVTRAGRLNGRGPASDPSRGGMPWAVFPDTRRRSEVLPGRARARRPWARPGVRPHLRGGERCRGRCSETPRGAGMSSQASPGPAAYGRGPASDPPRGGMPWEVFPDTERRWDVLPGVVGPAAYGRGPASDPSSSEGWDAVGGVLRHQEALGCPPGRRRAGRLWARPGFRPLLLEGWGAVGGVPRHQEALGCPPRRHPGRPPMGAARLPTPPPRRGGMPWEVFPDTKRRWDILPGVTRAGRLWARPGFRPLLLEGVGCRGKCSPTPRGAGMSSQASLGPAAYGRGPVADPCFRSLAVSVGWGLGCRGRVSQTP